MIRALAGLLVWTSLTWAQRPSDADAAAMVERTRVKALAYARSLPDFMCTEVIRRYSANQPVSGARKGGGVGLFPAETKWTPTDKLTVKLTFFQQTEDHKLLAINDKPTDRKYEGLTGGVGAGEFGGTLQNIFDPASRTAFHWASWRSVRRHRAAVYSYRVEAAHSRYLLMNGTFSEIHKAVVGFHGELEIDDETGELLRFTYVADKIPGEVMLDRVSTTVEYNFAYVGGRSYLLPARSTTEIYSPRLSVRNDTEFRDYGKFSSDSTVTFGEGK